MVEQQDERGDSGPLGELLPGLFRKEQRFVRALVHPRVSRLEDERGRSRLILGSFGERGDVRELHRTLKPILEAALLHELSLARDDVRTRRLSSIELYTFAPFPFDPTAALMPFGLAPVNLDPATMRSPLALLRAEARFVEGARAEEPARIYRASVHEQNADFLCELESELSRTAPLGPWGSAPGALARALAGALASRGYAGVEPSRAGIERAERALLAREVGVIRWIPPLCFQAFCDLLAVLAHGLADEVEWGVCEADPETGLAPPPVLRVETTRGRGHVPLGEHVLRWCVMPLLPNESVPSLGEWAEHEFAP